MRIHGQEVLVRAAVVAAVLLSAGCISVPPGTGQPAPRQATAQQQPDVGREESPVAAAALDLLGVRRLRVEGRRYNFDCSGSILAAHHLAGVDLLPRFEQHRGNGVARLWEMGSPVGEQEIKPGDVVFWDNTWDRNGSRRMDDELTHAGIVVSVDSDGGGTMLVMHHHYREGIVNVRMNLRHPGDLTLNDPMRMRSQRYRLEDPWLAGELFRGARRLY